MYVGPKIVEGGLVFAVDAGSKISYPGSGTTWYDLSDNGNNGTMVNSPSFSNGSITFDGIDDRIDVNLYHLSGSDHSEEVVIYRNATNTTHGILSDLQYGFYGLLVGSNNKVYFRQMQQNSDGQGGWSYPSVQILSTTSLGIGYHHITSTFSRSNGFKLYVNGILEASDSTDLPFNLSGNRGINHIGVYKNSNYTTYTNPMNGEINIVKCYNRELTSIEVYQNYKAIKNRFGL